MDEKTLKALRGSIDKWERIVAGEIADKGSSNCPLCAMFLSPTRWGEECRGCPVALGTDGKFCVTSPYPSWLEIARGKGRYADTLEMKEAAQKELDFLKSLLPPAEQARDALIEKIARQLCDFEGYWPDAPIHYTRMSDDVPCRADPIRGEYIGSKRPDGSVVRQWPTMPQWKFRFGRRAAQLADLVSQESATPIAVELGPEVWSAKLDITEAGMADKLKASSLTPPKVKEYAEKWRTDRRDEALKWATHRHYKGGYYRYIGEALHTETEEVVVVYQHVWPNALRLYVRPKAMFDGRLPDGRLRFTPLSGKE